MVQHRTWFVPTFVFACQLFTHLQGVAGAGGAWKKAYPPWDPSSPKPKLVIPIIVPMTVHSCGPSRYMSMRVAVSNINDRDATLAPAIATLQNDFQVEYVVYDDSSNSVGALSGLIELQKRLGGVLKVVLGPNGSGPSQASSPFLTVFNVPQISWAATSLDLSNKATYPNFYRVCPPDSFRFKVLVNFVAFLGFTKMNLAYMDDAFNIGEKDAILLAISQLNAANQSLGLQAEQMLKINSNGGVALNDQNKLQLKIVLDTLKRSTVRIIFALALNEPAYNIMEMAFALGLLSPGYIWLSGDGLSGGQLKGDISRVPACHGSIYIAASTQGPSFPTFRSLWNSLMDSTETPEFDNFTDVCAGGVACSSKTQFTGWVPGKQKTTFSCPGYAELAYDAALVLVKVADELVTRKKLSNSTFNNPSLLTAADWWAGMKTLVNRNTTIDGLSGPISFDANQERLLDMTFSNWRNGSLTAPVVASWSAVAGFQWKVGTQMFWPGLGAGINITSPSTHPFPAGVEMGKPMPCSIGEVFDTSIGQCASCPAGSFAPSSTNGNIVTSCVQCGKGSYSATQGMTECTICPAGTAAGLGSPMCAPCLPGSSADSMGSAECTACAPGSAAATAGSSKCGLCGKGFFAEQRGSLTCNSCVSRLASSTTELLGAENRTLCVCPEGMFREGTDSTACKVCPDGMTCAIGSDMRHFETARRQMFTDLAPGIVYPALKVKHYSHPDSPLHVFKCASAARCPGGGNWENVCGEGAVGRSCAHCAEDWAPDGKRCKRCKNIEVSGFIFPGLPIIFCPIVVVLLYFLFRDMPSKWGTWKNGLSAMIYLVLSYYQMAAMILDVPLLLPGEFSSSLNIWQSSIDVVSLFAPSCVGVGGFTKTFMMRALIPIIFGVVTSGTFVLSHILSRCSGRQKQFAMEFDRTVNLYFSVLFAFFIGIAAASLSLFKCQDNPSNERTLTQDLSVICGDNEWNSVLVVAILCILVYCVGCGAVYIGVIIIAPRRFSTESFQKRWKFLFIKYNSVSYWWSAVILAKGILLALSSAVIQDPLGQLYWLMFVCMVYMTLLFYFIPWRFEVVNSLDAVIHLSIISLMSISTLFFDHSGQDIQGNIALGLFATVMSCSPFMLFPFFFLALVRHPLERKYFPTYYKRCQDSMLKTMRGACESLGHLKPEDVTLLLNNLEEYDRMTFYAACKAMDAELFNNAQRRLSSGLSHSLGKSVEERRETSKSQSKDDANGRPALVVI